MRSIQVTLSKSTADGQFRVSRLSLEGESRVETEIDAWNTVLQILRLMDKPEAQTATGFPYSFPFAFEPENKKI